MLDKLIKIQRPPRPDIITQPTDTPQPGRSTRHHLQDHCRLRPVTRSLPAPLVGAMAAARADSPHEARASLALAREAGQHLGYDGNHAWTSFGPTNVAVHEVSVALELGDMQRALHLAPQVDVSPLPAERRVRHALEVARIYHYAGRPDDAVDAVLRATQEAPEQTRYHFITRELAISWMRDPRTRGRREVTDLAQRLQLG